jgi:hypothetical protein
MGIHVFYSQAFGNTVHGNTVRERPDPGHRATPPRRSNPTMET